MTSMIKIINGMLGGLEKSAKHSTGRDPAERQKETVKKLQTKAYELSDVFEEMKKKIDKKDLNRVKELLDKAKKILGKH